MMPNFSAKSQAKLATCHPDLQRVFNEVVKHFDCTIVEGHRGKEDQDRYYAQGKSKVKYPNGKHNKEPSMAVDVIPYPIDWNARDRFVYFAGFVKGIATSLGVNIRWGGDWDCDTELADNTFDDLPHFELR